MTTRNLHGGRLKDWVFRFFQPPTTQPDLPFEDDAGPASVTPDVVRAQLDMLASRADEVEQRLAASVAVRMRHLAKG